MVVAQRIAAARPLPLNALQQVRNAHLETGREHLQYPQSRFPAPVLKLRYMAPADTGDLRQICLLPSTIRAQLPEPPPEADANIVCHVSSMALRWRLMLFMHNTEKAEIREDNCGSNREGRRQCKNSFG